MYKKFISFLVSIVILLSCSTGIPAQESNIAYEKVNPGSVNYTFKRLKEKTLLWLLSPLSSKKTEIYENILKARLAELKKVVDEKDKTLIETTSQRYSSTVGQYTDYVFSKSKKHSGDAKSFLTEQRLVLETFLPNFDGTTAEWRFVKHDLDYLDLNLQKLIE